MEQHIRTVTIVFDNARLPTRSLLNRMRTRELQRQQQRRWMPSVPSLRASSPSSRSQHTSSSSSSCTSVPRVPRRQLSPPLQRRDEAGNLVAKDSALPSLSPTTTTTTTTTTDRPNLPVRSNNPSVSASEELQTNNESTEDTASESEQGEQDRTLDLSPMIPSRRNSGIPRIPRRKNSLLARSGLIDDNIDKEDESTLVSEATVVQEQPSQHDKASDNNVGTDTTSSNTRHASTSHRPSLPRRKSSFEILPASLLTRQSSFELRHRLHVSKSSDKRYEELYHRPTPQHSSSLPLQQQKHSTTSRRTASVPNIALHYSGNAAVHKRSADMTAGEDLSKAHSNDKKAEQRERAVQVLARRSTDRSKMPPRRQWSIESTSSCDSVGSTGSKGRFRHYRTQRHTNASLPVRKNSFDSYEKVKRNTGRLPGRQSSFPGVHSTFQHL